MLLAAYVLLGALTLLPVFITTIPPLIDYPNHLARMSILVHGNDGSAVTANYLVHWRLVPNLAMDLVVPSLARLMPLEDAGRCFILLTMALLFIGTVLLHRVLHGRLGLWPLTALLFVYNTALWWGFLGYLFGLGMALLGFTAWLATARWKISIRLVVFALLSCVLYVLHLFAFGVYGLLVASHATGALGRRAEWSRPKIAAASLVLVQFIPAGALWLLSAGGPSFTAYGDYMKRVYGLIAPATFNFPPTLLDLAILMMPVFLGFLATRGAAAIRLHPSMRLPLIAMAVVSALIPTFLNGSWLAQIRLPIALVFVAIASTRIEAVKRVPVAVFAALVLLLLGLRIWTVAEEWRAIDPRIAELRTAMNTMPEGVRVLMVQDTETGEGPEQTGFIRLLGNQPWMTYLHWPVLAVIDRGAFVPPLFTNWFPIDPAPRNIGLPRTIGGDLKSQELIERAHLPPEAAVQGEPNPLGELPCCYSWPRNFDFVVWTDLGKPPETLPPELEPWADGSFFHIYKVRRP